MVTPPSPSSASLPLTESELQGLLRGGSLAGSWTLDPARSTVKLTTRHTWGLLPLHGGFGQVSGHGTVTPAGEVSGVLTVAAESISTKNPTRDKHLRSPAFFDIGNHPEITFAVASATPGSAGVQFTGELTVAGRSRPATVDAAVTRVRDELTVNGKLPVDRRDFGLTWNFMGIAANQSTISVRAVFTRAN